jgi:hypothetical protein
MRNLIIKKENFDWLAEEVARMRKTLLKDTEDLAGACLQFQLGQWCGLCCPG